MKVQGIVALAVVALAAAACGGGGGVTAPSGSSNVVVPPASTPTAVAAATAAPTSAALPAGYAFDRVSISMAKGTYAASVRRVQAIGVGTQSIVFTLLQQNGAPVTGTPQTFALTASSQFCTVNATTQVLSCVLPVSAPIGQDVFLAQTYSTNNGTGTLTGSGAVALSVGLNATNTASIVLNAQVSAVYVVAGDPFLGVQNLASLVRARGAQAVRRPLGQATTPPANSSMPVFVVAVDSSGNTILNPSAYNAPLYLQLAFDPNYGFNYFGNATPDVTLSVTYGANDPSPCTGGTATATGFYGSFPLCSPSDNVTAALSPTGGANPAMYGYIFGYILSSQLAPTPAPSQAPVPIVTPSANSFAQFYVYYPTPSPSPTASPTGGSIQVNPQ